MPREQAETQLSAMLRELRHEPFYETGTWIDESLGAYIGWVVQKNSFADGMPLRNERGDVVLIFSGDDYPEPDTKLLLKDRGHSFDAKGSSYLVHLYENDPTFFLAGLNGQFHGVLVDRTQRALTVFNDRYGMHRLHYHESKDAFYLSAEAKAILAIRPELRTPDPKSLGEFVACSCVLEDRTIFKGIQTLPGASSWIFRNGSLERKSTYFQPQEWENQGPQDAESYYRELRDVLCGNLPRYFNGHQQVGIALTGGLDTRAILACRKPPPNSLPCYTFGGSYRDCQDVLLAREVARVCRQSHQVIPVGEDFLARFPRYAERTVYLTEGGVDVYRSSDLYVSEKAREIAPVKVVGTYGSEIVRHAIMFKPVVAMDGLYDPGLLRDVHDAGNTYRAIRREHPVTFAAFRQSPWYHHGILALEQSQLSVRSPYLDNDFVRTAYRAPKLDIGANSDVRLRLIGDGDPVLARLRSDRGIGGDSGRLAAAASRSFLEFTFKAEYAYDYGMPQWLVRVDHLLSPIHPERLFLGRHKLLHFRVWYRDELSKYVKEMLLDPLTLSRPYLGRKSVEAIVHGHLRGEKNHTLEIHKLLTLELLHRLFFDAR
jgi:asparagine synthase (glutamine-hydrolysing)